MSLYIIEGDYDYGHAVANSSIMVLPFYDLAHNHKILKWNIPELNLQVFRKKIYGLPTDCPFTLVGSYGLLLSLRAKELLQPLFDGCGEFYPIRLEGMDYTWFNVTAVLENAFNDELTIGERWKHEDLEGWGYINNYAFNEEATRNAPNLFRVNESARARVFCRQEVADFIRSSDLLGFDIKKVWRSFDDKHLFSEKCGHGEPAVEFHHPTTFRWTKEEAKAVKLKRKNMIKKLTELGRIDKNEH